MRPPSGTPEQRPPEPDAGEPPDARGLPAAARSSTPIAIAVALGGLWGLVGYGVLWEGRPVEVTRAFVNSLPGLFTLLPVRLVIWGIRGAESIAGRSFDLSSTNLWIAPVASGIGALIALAALLAGGAVLRRLPRRGRR